jgi:hypothetical protein
MYVTGRLLEGHHVKFASDVEPAIVHRLTQTLE